MQNQKIANRALLTRYKRGDAHARDELVNTNIGLVTKYAYKWKKAGVLRGTSLTAEDLIQEGVIGLMTAIDRWDPARGELSTIATPWIIQSMQRALANTGTEIRKPVHVNQELIKIRKAQEALAQKGLHDPTYEQLAEATGLRVERVENALTSPWTVSLDKETNDETAASLADFIRDQRVDVESEVIEAIEQDRIMALLDELPVERWAEILRLHYGLDGSSPMTLAEIGEELGGVSRQRIHQQLAEAKAWLLEHARLEDGHLTTEPAQESAEGAEEPQEIQEAAAMQTDSNTLDQIRTDVLNEIEQHKEEARKHLVEVERLEAGLAFLEERLPT